MLLTGKAKPKGMPIPWENINQFCVIRQSLCILNYEVKVMIGIYAWTSKLTGEKYIGQSIDIDRRRAAHERNWQYNKSKFYDAVRAQGGIQNFTFQVLEECEQDKLDERECYYINLYDTYYNGFNDTKGGQNQFSIGECNGRTQLTNEDVLYLRNQVYLNHQNMWDLYPAYASKIAKSSFWAMIHGITWKNVDTSMIYSLAPLSWTNFNGSRNPKAKLHEEDVIEIRRRHVNGESNQSIYIDYRGRISESAFMKIIRGSTWIGIGDMTKITIQPIRKNKPKAKLTKEDVLKIRQQAAKGMPINEICQQYPYVSRSTIVRVINYETWKNVTCND